MQYNSLHNEGLFSSETRYSRPAGTFPLILHLPHCSPVPLVIIIALLYKPWVLEK